VPESVAQRVALLGGSFDPPHVAHVLLAAYVLLMGEVDEVLVVPVCEHAFGKRLAPFADRVALCELAFAGLRQVRVSRVEEELPHPNRTLATLQRLKQQDPELRLRLLVGSDVLADAAKWHAFDEVVALAPLLVVPRPGHAAGEALVMPDVSSTRVRELLTQRGDPAALRELSALVPRAVLDYALENQLYAR
jgi:nicotinate-nucleotide adenylyltransferase